MLPFVKNFWLGLENLHGELRKLIFTLEISSALCLLELFCPTALDEDTIANERNELKKRLFREANAQEFASYPLHNLQTQAKQVENFARKRVAGNETALFELKEKPFFCFICLKCSIAQNLLFLKLLQPQYSDKMAKGI